MSLSPSTPDNSPEPAISDVCRNLETQFTQDLSKAEGMHVFARVRPMLNSEIEAGYKECIGTVDDETIRAVVPSSSVKFKSSSYQDITEDFKFTSAYGPEVGQFVFFQESMMNTMQNFIDGQNSLVFSYGITGSGKTFTLQGNIDNPGIIPLSLHLFFASIENQLLNKIVVKPDKFSDVNILNDNEIKEEYQVIDQLLSNNNQEEWSFRNTSKKSLAMVLCETFSDKFESDGLQTTLGPEEMAQAQAAAVMKELSKKCAMQQNGYCSVWVSFAEIYNEYIYDLLQPNINQRAKLTLGEDKNGDVYVKGLREVCVFNSFDALKLLNIGQKNLKIASTKLNYQSSRSHCIFTVKVVRIPDPENITSARVSRLSFCDLAGSERANKSQTTGLRLKEAGCINTSLLVLGRCLEQLRLNPSLRDKKRIPFRESKLTRLLSGFFTGRGKAVMITNASPSEVTFDETLHALRFSALATELIINDSYIATASNTLQTITNMWTDARNNVSISSNKSISFEDSTVEALQEKDELIEKLLDLAESLTNNLEKEKKEKAGLEIKIRQEVCQEYSEYSDELLDRQKQNYEEEQEAIREIYKKRISGMEKMYEKIIEDLKSQMEESDSSCDESTTDGGPGSMKKKRKSSVLKNSFNGDTKENTEMKEEEDSKNNYFTESERLLNEMESLKQDLMSVSEELKRVKEELKKSKDYSLSLESAAEEMEQKFEISVVNLEKALSENCELRIKIDYLQASHEDTIKLKEEIDDNMSGTQDFETLKEQFDKVRLELENALKYNEELIEKLDFVKIDCVSYKADNDDLFKKKTVLEEQLKSCTEELAFTKSEKEDLYQKLTESEENVIQHSNEASTFLKKNNDLIKQLEDAKVEYENSLEEYKKRATDAEEALKSINQTLDIAITDSEQLKATLVEFETECADLRAKNTDILKRNEDLEAKYSLIFDELACAKSEKEDLYQKLTEWEKNSEEINILLKQKNELIKQMDGSKKEYENSLEEFKKRASNAEDILKSVNETLSEALRVSEEQKEKLAAFETECFELKDSKMDILKKNEELEGKYAAIVEELLAEQNKTNCVSAELEKLKKELDLMKSECVQYEEKAFTLQETICDLEAKLDEKSSALKELESEKAVYNEEFNRINSKLSESLSALEEEKKKVEELLAKENFDEKEYSNPHTSVLELLKNSGLMDSVLGAETLKDNDICEIIVSKLSEAQCIVDKQKAEIENLANDINSYKNTIAELEKQNEEMMNKINSMDYKQELKTVSSKLEEALSALDKEKQEIENLKSLLHSDKMEILLLQKQNKELQDSLDSQTGYKIELDAVTSKLNETLCALEKQKEEAETLANVTQSDKKEIGELQNKIKELQDKFNSEIDYKKELDAVTSKLNETLCALEKQKEEAETLANVTQSDKKEIVELQNKIKELQDKFNSEIDYKKELDAVTNKLNETLCALEKQKEEAENLANTAHSDKKEVEELQNKVKELQDSLNSEIGLKATLKQELDSVKNSLEEAFGTINGQKEEMQDAISECSSLKNKITDLMKIKEELQEKINSQESQTDIMNDLMHVVEKCEREAAIKIDKMQSDFTKLKEENESLKELQRKNFDSYESELNRLREMIQTLQYCEMQATKKTKELHTSSIKHVEQIMDLEKCIKERDLSIENLKNDYNALQKQLKDFQVTSKKQLQTEKQQYLSEIGSIKSEKIIFEKENKTLKNQVTELETAKGTLESKVKSMEKKLEKMDESKNEVAVLNENLTNESKKSLKTEPEKITSDKKKSSKDEKENEHPEKASTTNKESKTVTKKSSTSRDKADKKSKQSSKDKNESEPTEKKEEIRSEEKLPEKRSLRKTVRESEENTEEVEKKASKNVKNLGDKKKTKLKENSAAVPEGKKLKTVIYEEDQENLNSQNITQKVRSSNRKQLRSVENENVEPGLALLKNKDLSSSKSKGSKRKELNVSENDKLHEKKTLKKIKLQDMNEIENISSLKKPQNLRIQLLKANIATNDIPVPSPRMTRGRKKLCILNAKENISQSKASPRTVRS